MTDSNVPPPADVQRSDTAIERERPDGIDGRAELDRLLRQEAFSTRDLLSGDTLDKVMRLANVMAAGKVTCPKHLQGNPGDCAAVIGQAMRWGMDHNAVAQKTHLINGTLGYEAQLIIAVLNSSPLLKTRLSFLWAGGWDGMNGKEDASAEHWCEVSATLRGERAPRVLRVSMAQVGGVRNSPNWGSDARQQLAYLGAKRWGRLHAPDVILGVYTPDELLFGREDDPLAGTDVVGHNGGRDSAHDSAPAALTVEQLADWRAAAAKGTAGARAHWLSMGALRALATPEQKNETWSIAVRADEARAAAAAKTPAQPAADPSTGEIDDDFVAAMNAAEKEGAA